MKPHDHNFKNLFLDFPREALEWLLPEVPRDWGRILRIEFPRQEPKKRNLADAALALDMPILFTFEYHRLLLWLVEFQEDKTGFSIYRLLRYMTDLMEAHPEAIVAPTVLFTDKRKWRKDVARRLTSELHDRRFLHFEYLLVKLFDFAAKDYYHSTNPIVRILLPKMKYAPDERIEVIRRAYQGLFELTTLMLFDKHADFIDLYAEVTQDERETIYQEIKEHKETAMLAQYIRNKGFEEGIQQGIQQGIHQGIQQGIHQGIQQGIHQGIQQGIHQGIQQGIQQGEQKGARRALRETIRRMHRKGMHASQIADILEMEIKQVECYLKDGEAGSF